MVVFLFMWWSLIRWLCKQLNENDLDNIIGGIPYEQAVEKQSDFFKRTKPSSDELTEEQLESVIAGVPGNNIELPQGTYINEYGEIIRQEDQMRR